MSHITLNDLVITTNRKIRIYEKEKYQPLKNLIINCILLPLASTLLISCKSEPKKQPEQQQTIQNQINRKYDDNEFKLKKQIKKTLDQKTIIQADSLNKSDKLYSASPILISNGTTINKKQTKSSSGQRKGKVIYSSKSKKQNQWKR